MEEFTEEFLSSSVKVRFTLPGTIATIKRGDSIEYGGYLRQMMLALQLSPKKVKSKLVDKGVRCTGMWPSHESKEPVVTHTNFVNELVDNNGDSSLTILYEFDYSNPHYTIPIGTRIGLYDAVYDKGSSFEMVLIKELNVKSWKAIPDENPGFQLNNYL